MARRSSSRRSSSRSRSRGDSQGKSRGRKYGRKAQSEVRTEMRHMKSGKHPVNRQQAIAIGLSKARRKGAKVPPRSKKAA